MKQRSSQRAFRYHHPDERGQALIIALFFFLAANLIFLVGVSAPTSQDVRGTRTLIESKQSYALAEGSGEDVAYRILLGKNVDASETLVEGAHSVTTTVTDVLDGKEILSVGDVSQRVRKTRITVVEGDGAAFNFGIQSDVGGIIMQNNSSVLGNVFSNGTAVGENSNLVKGDVISGGPDGLVDGVHATGTVYANTIADSTIEGDAYYQSISGTTVDGTLYPGSPDQPTSTLPIHDDLVAQWESDAVAGGTINEPCPYVIDDSTATSVGPVKITCDVIIEKSAIVDIEGMVWITGNLTIRNTPTIRVGPSIINQSVAIITDNPANRLTSSQIDLQNANEFQGNGTKSYIMLLSQNESAEQGGTEFAIQVSNSAEGEMIVYAGHGEVVLKNNVNLREVTAYRIRLQNFAEVVYSTGLASTIFTSGPSGGFDIVSWREVE